MNSSQMQISRWNYHKSQHKLNQFLEHSEIYTKSNTRTKKLPMISAHCLLGKFAQQVASKSKQIKNFSVCLFWKNILKRSFQYRRCEYYESVETNETAIMWQKLTLSHMWCNKIWSFETRSVRSFLFMLFCLFSLHGTVLKCPIHFWEKTHFMFSVHWVLWTMFEFTLFIYKFWKKKSLTQTTLRWCKHFEWIYDL